MELRPGRAVSSRGWAGQAPSRFSAGGCLRRSAQFPPEFLGPSEHQKLKPGVQPVRAPLGTPMREGERAPGLRRQATAAGAARGARDQRRVGRMPGQRRLTPSFSALPDWGGARTGKVAVAGPVKPGGARPATHLSRVGSRADSARALRPSSCGPRRVADAQLFPWATGSRLGWGDPELRGSARDSARSSLPASPPVPTRHPPAARSGLRGAARGPRSHGTEHAGLRRLGPSAALPAPCPRRLCGAERSWAERCAHCSLAFRKATLAAGRRDAGLTHARARVNARLSGSYRGSDGRRRRREWAGGGRGSCQGA